MNSFACWFIKSCSLLISPILWLYALVFQTATYGFTDLIWYCKCMQFHDDYYLVGGLNFLNRLFTLGNLNLLFIMCISAFVHMVCACECGCPQKSMLRCLELEWPVEVVSCLMRILGTKLRSSGRAAHALNYWATSPGPTFHSFRYLLACTSCLPVPIRPCLRLLLYITC